MKKIICIVLCLLMVAAAFAGCSKKPKTYEEAAAAGQEFIKSAGLKSIKTVSEISGAGEFDGAKVVIEGTFDPKTEKGIFSIGYDLDNMSFTLKDEIVINGRKVYIKVPDQSTLEKLIGKFAAVPSVYEDPAGYDYMSVSAVYVGEKETADDYEGIYTIGSLDEGELVWGEWDGIDIEDIDLGELGLSEDLLTIGADDYGNDYGYDYVDPISNIMSSLLGKYIMIELPDKDQVKTIIGIYNDATQSMYEKAEKLDAEEGYPYVVKFDLKNAYDLAISILDGVKGKKSDIAKEVSALAKWYLGDNIFAELEESIDGTLANKISEELDKAFESAEIPNYDEIEDKPEKFEIIQKIAYENNKKFEYVQTTTVKVEDQTISGKTTVTVTAADKDADFESKCTISEEKTYDVIKELKKMYDSLKSTSSEILF